MYEKYIFYFNAFLNVNLMQGLFLHVCVYVSLLKPLDLRTGQAFCITILVWEAKIKRNSIYESHPNIGFLTVIWTVNLTNFPFTRPNPDVRQKLLPRFCDEQPKVITIRTKK